MPGWMTCPIGSEGSAMMRAAYGDARSLYPQSISHSYTQPPTSSQTNDLDDLEEPPSDACVGGNKRGETLREDFSWAGRDITEKFPRLRAEGARIAQHEEARRACADSDCEYASREIHIKDIER